MAARILIVDDEPMCRELLARVLRDEGHHVVTAADGKQALAVLAKVPVELMLLDLAMPEVDGLTLLRRLRKQTKTAALPVAVLTGVNRRELLGECARLGVRDFLLKGSFSLPVLLERIRKLTQPGAAAAPPAATPAAAIRGPSAIAASAPVPTRPPVAPPALAAPAPDAVKPNTPIPKLLTREQAMRRVDEFTESKTLAGVVTQVISLTNSPRGSVAELVTLLKRDVVLASRVLRVANTAAFASNKPHVGTIEEAVRNVGLSAVRDIATSVGIIDAFPSDGPDGFNILRCWQHCFAVSAILQRLLARSADRTTSPSAAHLVGLCHEIGEMVLRQCFPEVYAQSVELARAGGRGRQEVEAEMLGVRHQDLVTHAMSKLSLPPDIFDPICEYIQRGGGRTVSALSHMAQALRLADFYAHGLMLCPSPAALVQPFGNAEYRRATGVAEAEPVDGMALRNEVLMQTWMLAGMSSADEAKLARPLFAKATRPIWYARHPSFSSFDPLAAALGLLGDCRVESRLPAASETEANTLIVVAAPRDGLPAFSLADLQEAATGGRRGLLCIGADADTSAATEAVTVQQYPVSLERLSQLAQAGQQVGDAKQLIKAA